VTEYTPGPWGVDDAGGEAPFGVFAEDGDAVCYLTENPMGGLGLREYAEDQANARLIAAAPDLLEAAKAFVAINECACPTPQDMPFDEELPAFPEWIKTNRCYWHKARAAIAAAEGVE